MREDRISWHDKPGAPETEFRHHDGDNEISTVALISGYMCVGQSTNLRNKIHLEGINSEHLT